MTCLCWMEYAVVACYLEALDILETTDGTTLVVEVKHDGVALDVHIFIRRTLADDATHAVGLVQCQESQALAHLLLLGRVNLSALVRIDSIVGAHQSAIGNNL